MDSLTNDQWSGKCFHIMTSSRNLLCRYNLEWAIEAINVYWMHNGTRICGGVVDEMVHGPLARYVKLRVAHAPGMPGTFSPPWRVSDPDMHHGMCVTPESLTGGCLWSQWRGKRSRHSRRMRIPQFYVSGKRSIVGRWVWNTILFRRRYNLGAWRICLEG